MVPPTQVEPRAQRRRFTLEYKRSIVEQAAACSEPGAVGALLRKEGLYSSHLVDWRRQLTQGQLGGSGHRSRGPNAKPGADAKDQRIAQLEREVAKLRLRATKAEATVEFQKKCALLLAADLTELPGDVV